MSKNKTISGGFAVTPVYDGQDGPQGPPGNDGKGITSADIMFCLADSQTTAPADGSFTATSFADLNIKSTDANKYVWQCNKTTYTSGSPTYSGKVCLGKVSDFASVVEQYALGTASAATGTWQDNNPPSPTKGSYLWTRTKLSYTGGGETYSPSSAGICLGYYGSDGAPGSQGPQGDGAAEVYVSPGSITVPCTNAGAVASQITQGLTFSMRVGTHAVDANNIKSITAGTCPTGVSVQAVYVNVRTVTITTSATASGMAAGIEFTVVGTYDGKDYTAKCTLALIGSKQGAGGQKGDTGPMFYLCGEWANNTEYERTKQRCPVVYYGGKYWYLENEGTSTGDTPGPSSSVWEEAENFNMVFTDVLFVKNFAKLGSGIISGDWLISCAGYIVVNGVKTYYGPEDEYGNAPAYMQFDEDYPDSDNGQNNFMPVYAVDLATGVTYQQKAHIQGSLRASLFEYKVYSSSDAGVGYIVPADADYYYFSYPYGQASTTLQVTLPYAGDLPGKMITLIQPYSDELDWNQIRLYGKDENGDPYGVFVILDANHQPSSGTGYPIGKCSKVVVWADPADCANNGGTWHILEQPMHIRAILKEEGLIS